MRFEGLKDPMCKQVSSELWSSAARRVLKLPHHEWASYKSYSVLETGDISLSTFRSVKQEIAQLENALKEKSFSSPPDHLF